MFCYHTLVVFLTSCVLIVYWINNPPGTTIIIFGDFLYQINSRNLSLRHSPIPHQDTSIKSATSEVSFEHLIGSYGHSVVEISNTQATQQNFGGNNNKIGSDSIMRQLY